MNKSCFKCGKEKPRSEFYRHSQMGDGLLGKCKDCAKKDVREHRRLNESVREYDRARAKTEKRKEQAARLSERWNAAHPIAYKAHTAVSNAVRDKKLTKQPCLFCGSERVHAHHRDYTKPLEVTWLCAKCHHRLHKTFPETAAHEKS